MDNKKNKSFEKILFKRPNFFPGLKATPNFWNDLEDYHYNKERLYNCLFNGFGIVPDFMSSLYVEVQKVRPGMVSLLINPGMAIDGYGRAVFLYEPEILVLDYKKYTLPCTVYITIRYNEQMEDFYKNNENFELQGYQHKREGCLLEVVSNIPDPDAYIEIARIRLADADRSGVTKVTSSDPTKFVVPKDNELDYRFIQWTSKTKRGISVFFQNYMLNVFDETEKAASGCYSILPVASLLNLQTISMTAKMIVQTSGAYFEDIVNMFYPMYNSDYQVVFEIAEYERKHPGEELGFITKDSYQDAREAVYMLGDAIKAFNATYEELDNILKLHTIVIDGLRKSVSEKEISTKDIMLMSTEMPKVLLFDDAHYTLVDTLLMGSKESLQMHDVRFIGCSYPTTSNETFTYPDGKAVNDVVKRWIGGQMKFSLRNVVKGNPILIVRRTDVYNGNYQVQVSFNGQNITTINIDGIDTKNRWRNYYFSIDRNMVTDFSPEVSFDIGEKGRDNSASIWIYQVL